VHGYQGVPGIDSHGQVLHVGCRPIPGLYAVGNAMAAALGVAFAGAGGAIGPALVWGHHAAAHAAAR
jgi:3-oxosteroid 1-dehydrogenase